MKLLRGVGAIVTFLIGLFTITGGLFGTTTKSSLPLICADGVTVPARPLPPTATAEGATPATEPALPAVAAEMTL